MNSKILVLVSLCVIIRSACAQQLLLFGTATVDEKVMQCRFEVQREGVIRAITLAPYGFSPTKFQEVKDTNTQLTFSWTNNRLAYQCRLLKINELAYEGDCSYEHKPSIRLTIHDFTKEDAFLQGDSLHASPADIKILDRALELLGRGQSWNRSDNRVCDVSTYPYKWSLFCALHQASIEIGADYRHLRPAVQAARQAINEVSAGKKYAHLLQDFNNESPDFTVIEKVLERAQEIIKEKIALRQ